MNESNPLRALVFDFDDTLVHSPRTRWPILMATAGALGFHVDEDDIHEVWGLPYREMITRLMPGVEVDTFTKSYADRLASIPNDLAPSVGKLAQDLHQRGIYLCILTSNSSVIVEQDLQSLGLSPYFHFVAGCDEVDHHKPDGRSLTPILSVLAQLGVPASGVAMVGDSWRDAQAASDAGIGFAAVLTGHDDAERFASIGIPAARVCATLSDAVRSLIPDLPTGRA